MNLSGPILFLIQLYYLAGKPQRPRRISSTAEDLLKWDRLYTNKLISQQTLNEAFTPMKLSDGKLTTYGFGWVIISNDPSGKIVWHNGDNPGIKQRSCVFLEKKIH
jgi:CubicO group peptidase (beta-lactamase class C family)